MRHLFGPALLLAAVAAPLLAQPAAGGASLATQPSATFNAAQAGEVVHALATALQDRFVLPDIAGAYASALRSKLEAGGYSGFDNREAFAKAVTADLQAINKDGHLALRASTVARAPTGQRREDVKGIARTGWLSDGVAYIDFRIFNGDDATLAELSKFLSDHREAKALIIDARKHYGGGLDEMDVLFPALFAKPTGLLWGDLRAAVADTMPGARESHLHFALLESPQDVVRHEHRAIPPAGGGLLKDAKIYLLVSRDTVSAGEHLAMALKRTGRATLIGQTTRGAGNFGRPVKLPHDFSAFIPYGRTFDPDTGEGWEGTGVAPDIAIAPERALDEALRLAGSSVTGEAALASLK